MKCKNCGDEHESKSQTCPDCERDAKLEMLAEQQANESEYN